MEACYDWCLRLCGRSRSSIFWSPGSCYSGWIHCFKVRTIEFFFEGLVTQVILWKLSGTAQALIGAAAGDIANLISTEVLKDGAANPLPITTISDQCGDYKIALLAQIDHDHSAVFSNGYYDGTAGAKVGNDPINV